MMGMTGRAYQLELIDKTYAEFKAGKKSVLIQLATGGGKTFIATEMIRRALIKGKRCWFICNRVELVEQTCAALYKLGVRHGIISAGYAAHLHEPVQVCSIQTLSRRILGMKREHLPDLIFWDETRGIAARTWDNVYHNNPQAFHVGLDATPERLGGQPLKKYYQSMVQGPSVRWLMDHGFLCDYVYYRAPEELDFTDVRVSKGDYLVSDLDALMNNKKIIGNAVREYEKKAPGKRNLIFCNSIQHSLHTCELFLQAGIKAEHIDGATDRMVRSSALSRFASGETKVLTSVDLVTAGLDIPAIECVTLARKTRSIALAKQMIGRGLRTAAGKDRLIILDQVGLWKDFGVPDSDYEWTLEGRRPADRPKVESLTTCEKCYAAYKPFIKVCPECGHVRQVASREQDFTHTDDELVELDREAVKRQRLTEQGAARTHEELTALGIRRGMKSNNAAAWAKHIMNARQAKKNRGMG